MLLSRNLSLEDIIHAFAPLRDVLRCPMLEDPSLLNDDDAAWAEDLTASNCWGALWAVAKGGMIDFGQPHAEDGDSLCVEELLHYSE